ncbi:PASTA domain-containing protein [Streptomyces durbertensis]|uniref:PASTA domain-containing protein n=1 Tax=Streptomyces durbertensis TaxID=2448886 RepID=A0ABR6EG09_9ACTN|nr:PASTA domain-containing protein [Streptomyces durbertensis]MBB1244264.1 PASTA domain-containing protein [Streptomyces durbertensis]
MRRTRRVAAALAAGVLTVVLVGCEAGDDGAGGGEASASATPTAAEAALPDLVGKGLLSAREAAGEAGFEEVGSHDALGRARGQALQRNWKVCFQEPAAGRHPADTEVDLGVVKLDEECPEKDGEVEEAKDSMPDFSGKSARAARRSLDDSTSIEVRDVSGEKRVVVMESNWRVCGQSPEPGAKLTGQPVRLDVVKFEEKCP